MALNNAHEGYEYQDLLTCYFILKEINNENEATFSVDRKEFKEDIIDDLTISNSSGSFKKQIKYSNETVGHVLAKYDLSNDSNYNLAVYSLFDAWDKNRAKNSTEFRICLAWEPPVDSLLNVLIEVNGHGTFSNYPTKVYKIDADKLWPIDQGPLPSWRKFKEASAKIDRNDFLVFCDQFLIEVALPKFSLNLYNAGDLEKLVLELASRLGIGTYPNQHLSKETFLLALLSIVKRARSKTLTVSTKSIFHELKIVTDFGSIAQEFPVIQEENLKRTSIVSKFWEDIHKEDKVLLVGEPGSGKSWFVENLRINLVSKKITVVRHLCYIGLDDSLQRERIQLDVFFGNLISELIAAFPDLSSFKQQKFASNLNELNLLLSHIDVPTVIIVDGLDHIERIAKFRNFTDIRSQDIAIIEHLGKLDLSEKVKIIVASQNIEDLKLIANFQRSELPKWRETEIKSFLTKNKVQNVKLEDGSTLSKFLLSKSSGNPLYLKYLIEEIHKLRDYNLAELENLPDYTFNLSGYYAYLLSQLNTREEVPQILSGVNFSLTKNELQEITHAGDLVEESLQILSPVLVVNISQSGYRIYHESFRRYILEYLESKSISIDKKIFNPIRDWFATKDFFKFRKSFRYFLKFLNEGGLHEEILSLLKYDFVSNSILNGYSWELIEMNYRIFVKSACSRNDFPNVVLLNEIDKVISLCPVHFEELAPVYLEAIGKVNGFEAVVESLLFEGQPAKGLLEGLKACYVCDENGVVAPWESYLDYFQVGKTIKLEDFKYYLRGQLVLKNAKRLNNVAKQLVKKKDTRFCEEFRGELFRYGNQDRIAELRAQFRSIDSLLSLQDEVSGSALTLDVVYDMADELLAVDNVFTRETDLVIRFLNGCRFYADDPSLEPTIVNKFKARNWFYNWLIYAVKMICLENKNTDYVKVHEAFAYLAYNVEPFEGKPRTCDLYSLHPVIYNSLNNGLKYLTLTSQWEDIIEILVKVSNGTSTTLQRSANGPLTTEKLFRLLSENSCTENRDLINQTFEMLAEEKSEWHLHTDVSEYHLRLASATSHADPVKAAAYLVKGISYGLAYTMRKDLTLLDAIDGVAFFHKINPSKAFDDLKKVRILVDSTIYHTDGRETDYFPVTWFERFLTMDRKRAMEYLLNELVTSRFDFRAEKSLIDLLCNLNGSLSPVTEAFISLTFPICDTEKFVRYQLVLHGKLKTGNPRLAEMLKSRIISAMRPKKDRNRSNETIRLFNDSVEPNERLSAITEKKASNPPKPKPFYQTAEDRQMFSDMDMGGLLAFIQLNGIKESYLHPLVYALDSFDGSDKGLRELVSTIVLKNNQNYYHRLDLDLTFQNGGELECQYWICRFMYDRGDWFERFIFQDAFKRAYAIDPQLALSSFFEILPSNLDVGFNSHFSSNLIQLLIDIGYDKATISKMWDNLLQMTSYRLPFQEDIEWDSIYADLDSMDEVELLDCILLSRFKAATTERFRWTSVAIQYLAETNHRGLIKPFQWFLDNKQRFEKSQQVIVLQTIHLAQENKAGFAANFRSILTKEFPTGYFLIDYIIQELYQLPINPISRPKGLIYPKIPQEEYDFIHHMNYKFKIYDSVGIDLGHCFNKFSSTLETKYGEYFELYGNRVYRRTISHTYAAEHMLEIMNTDCYEEFLNWSDFDYDGAFKYATFIDIDAIRAELFSFGCRPEDLPKPHELNGNLPITELAIQGENWIRIAHFEKELREEGVFKLKPFKGYGGISFSKSPKNKYPYAPYAVYPFQFWWDRKLNLPIDDEIALLVSKDDPIDHINLVWLNPTLIESMSLKTEISPEGLIAQNQKSEIVLKMRTWTTDYVGTSMRTVLSDEIPLIRGVDLIIREDYFKKLCGMFSITPRYMSFHIENYFP